jgi:hypothetical protein
LLVSDSYRTCILVTHMMPSPDPEHPPDEEDYVSEEDEDFNPDAANDDENISSDDASEGEDATSVSLPKGRKGKAPKKQRVDEAEDLGYENSGDEETIKKAARKRKKGGEEKDEDSGGEGGFVKTRSMRAVVEEQRKTKALASTEGATIDVDALWVSMNSKEALTGTAPPPTEDIEMKDSAPLQTMSNNIGLGGIPVPHDEMVTIKHSYVFAGETITEEKLVPRNSAQAQLYLKSQSAVRNVEKRGPEGQLLYRPLRRVSLWDPNPEGIVKGLTGSTTQGQKYGLSGKMQDLRKAPKLNVVDKSKLDWAAHVDKEGIQDELDKASKAKGGYLDRTDFLNQVENRREEELRNARRK